MGYFAQVVGAHDTDIAALVKEVQVAIRQRIGRLDFERSPHGGHWIMAGDDLTGRLVWQDHDEPYGVVVDGRPLSWEEPLEATEPSAFGPAPNTRTH